MKYIFLILFFFVTLFQSVAQDKFIKSFTVSSFFGNRNDKRDRFPDRESLDFLNYTKQDLEYSDYFFLGISSNVLFSNDIEAKLSFSFMGGLRDVNLITSYFLNTNWGINFGLYSNEYTVSSISNYHKNKDLLWDGDYHNDYQNITDYGINAGANFRMDWRRLHVDIQANIGTSTVKPFSFSIAQKEQNSNLRRVLEYNTTHNFSPYFKPEVDLKLDCFKFKKSILGLQFHSFFFLTQKSIHYNLTVYEWTDDNPKLQYVEGQKHVIQLFYYDVGLFYTF